MVRVRERDSRDSGRGVKGSTIGRRLLSLLDDGGFDVGILHLDLRDLTPDGVVGGDGDGGGVTATIGGVTGTAADPAAVVFAASRHQRHVVGQWRHLPPLVHRTPHLLQ